MLRIAAFLLSAAALFAQSCAMQPEPKPTSPTIRFDFSFPESKPAEYHIAVTEQGAATFDEPGNDEQDAYHSEFELAPEKAKWLFDAAHGLNDFSGDYDFHKHKVANTGEKRFTLLNGDKQSGTTFIYTENQQLQQLTTWMQGVAATQEFARRAKLHRKFDKLALDADVKQFVGDVQGHRATELRAIRPLLEQLAGDPAVLNSARVRLKQLLSTNP